MTSGLVGAIVLVALLSAGAGGLRIGSNGFGQATGLHADFAMFAPSVAAGQWYRLLTSAFLHYGLLHLAMNLYGLWIIGPVLERRLGSARFGMLFVVSTLGGSAGSAILEPYGLAAGASGALFGFLAAAVILERRRGVTRLLESPFGVWLLLGVVMTFVVPGLSVGGHLGGAVVGALASVPLFSLERREERALGVLSVVTIGLLATAVAVVASSLRCC